MNGRVLVMMNTTSRTERALETRRTARDSSHDGRKIMPLSSRDNGMPPACVISMAPEKERKVEESLRTMMKEKRISLYGALLGRAHVVVAGRGQDGRIALMSTDLFALGASWTCSPLIVRRRLGRVRAALRLDSSIIAPCWTCSRCGVRRRLGRVGRAALASGRSASSFPL